MACFSDLALFPIPSLIFMVHLPLSSHVSLSVCQCNHQLLPMCSNHHLPSVMGYVTTSVLLKPFRKGGITNFNVLMLAVIITSFLNHNILPCPKHTTEAKLICQYAYRTTQNYEILSRFSEIIITTFWYHLQALALVA